MTIKSTFLILFLQAFSLSSSGQAKKLGKDEFQKEILEQWWSFENKESKKDCDMRIMVIKTSGFELNCINWAEGFSGYKCGYELNITDNFFELKALKCQNNLSPVFLYGYVSENDNLFILLRKTQMALSPALFSEKDWIKFEKIRK